MQSSSKIYQHGGITGDKDPSSSLIEDMDLDAEGVDLASANVGRDEQFEHDATKYQANNSDTDSSKCGESPSGQDEEKNAVA